MTQAKTKEVNKWILKIAIMGVLLTMFITFITIYQRWDETKDNMVCYRHKCTKTNLDQFKECIELGKEKVGFLTSEYYYLCDGQKVTKNCIESERVQTNETYELFKDCEYKGG